MHHLTRTAQLLALATSASLSMGDILTVGPSLVEYDFITITAAISASVNGDVIEVHPGLYPENLLIANKDLTLRNAGGGTVTVFGQSLGKCLQTTGGSTDVVIEGITFSNGFSNTAGAGISIEGGSRAIIRDCIIEDNTNTAFGGGMYASGAVTVSNTVFRNNHSNVSGGGLYILGTTYKSFTDCIFENNTAVEGGGLGYASAGDTADLVSCRFISNSSTNRGGAIAVLGSTTFGVVDVVDSVFEMNHADNAGGAIWVSDLDAFHATNSLFINNNAVNSGGVARNEQVFEAVNCTFANNTVDTESVNDTFESNRSDADTNLLNCIVMNDSAGSHTGSGELHATYSLIPEAATGPADGNGNFNADPMFTNPSSGDFTLSMGSAAIDAGNSRGTLGSASFGIINVLDLSTDLNGEVRNLDDQDTPNSGLSTWELCVDLGAYEFQPIAVTSCPADLNGDRELDFLDISAFLSAYSNGCPE